MFRGSGAPVNVKKNNGTPKFKTKQGIYSNSKGDIEQLIRYLRNQSRTAEQSLRNIKNVNKYITYKKPSFFSKSFKPTNKNQLANNLFYAAFFLKDKYPRDEIERRLG